MKSLSVVIPTRDRLHVLASALDCLAKNSDAPDEVIVVDDHSDPPVSSALRVEDYPFPTRVILNEDGSGAPQARNTGIHAAKSELVLLLDDDILADTHLLRFHRYHHEQHNEPHYGVFGRVYFDPELPRTALMHYIEEWGAYREMTKLAEGERFIGGLITANVSFKREFLERFPRLFDINFPHNRNEDTEFGLRLMELGLDLRFHNGPSGRHHSLITFEKWLSILQKGGQCKAFWMLENPDDTILAIRFEDHIRKHRLLEEYERGYQEFLKRSDSALLESHYPDINDPPCSSYMDIFSVLHAWHEHRGFMSWLESNVSGFASVRLNLEKALKVVGRRRALHWYGKAFAENPIFIPVQLGYARLLVRCQQFEKARDVLRPVEDSIWASLILNKANIAQRRYQDAAELAMHLYERTASCKRIDREQRLQVLWQIEKIFPHSETLKEWSRVEWKRLATPQYEPFRGPWDRMVRRLNRSHRLEGSAQLRDYAELKSLGDSLKILERAHRFRSFPFLRRILAIGTVYRLADMIRQRQSMI